MKVKHLFLAAFAAVAMVFTSCEKEEDLGAAQVTVNPTELTFEASASSQSVSLKATRAWTATAPEWIALSTTSGDGSASEKTISVTVEENTGNNRSGEVVFNIGLAKATLKVTQAGPGGEIQAGDGSLESPFSVAGVVAYVGGLGADVVSTEKVYVKGKISSIKEAYSKEYGNGTFTISDDGSADGDQFTCYRIYYLGNKKWVEGNDQITVGDDVIIYGNVVNYKGNTPETQQNSAFLYSHNGKTDGGTEPEDPTKVQQITCAEFIEKADPNTTYRLVGEVTSTVNTTYCSFDMNDGTATVVVWTVNNKDEWKDVVKKGGTVTVRGKYLKYEKEGNVKHEMVDAYIEDFKEGADPGADDTPSGSGTLESPYNPKAAYDVAAALEKDAKTENDVYVAGKISSVKYTFSAAYGTATFNISEDGSTNGTQFPCYSVYYLGNRAWAEGDTQVAVGDEVIICGKLTNYGGNTPETASKAAYIYSLNGVTDGGEPAPVITVTSLKQTETGFSATWTASNLGDFEKFVWNLVRVSDEAEDGIVYTAAGDTAKDVMTLNAVAGTSNSHEAWNEALEVGTTYYFIVSAWDGSDYIAQNDPEKSKFTARDMSQSGNETTVTFTKDQLAAAAANGAKVEMDSVISFTNSTDYGSNTVTELRIYKGKTLTISADGATITKIEFTCTANGTAKQGPGCWGAGAPSGYTFDANGKTGEWAGSEASVAFTATDNQVRIEELTVTYTK